ncbi:hypothetical protein RUE5091_02989 [Ruegeria denitrificans]|uniref:Uncharacterized protein n=1 Tax=Ruegeria denitrificans TaxID=1715692 RepID=A0A0N7MA60_9RHOB|nr:hypothetical protein [Ruegeria denitrificans]CUK07775.1 hypothetical protein RUE5091_02989 [Ruegeria denitrificans]
MIRFAFLVATFITGATGAAAQDLTVRSGEHEGYTRLVVQVPPDTGWVLKQKKNGARLNVALKDATFQTGSVFQRLTQNRLAAISQAEPGGVLELEFGCDCVASAFLFKNTMIVVDIAPGTFLPPLTSDIPAPIFPKNLKENEKSAPKQSIDALALPLLNLNANGFEDQLSARLLQGADRGIVDLNISPVGPRASAGNQSQFMPPEVELNVQVTSILDELNGLLGPDIPMVKRRPPCISSAELAFDDWSDDRPFPEQAAQLRSGLYQEFDAIDKKRALKLAKLYAHSGFGAEAISALDLLGEQSLEAKRIAAIAHVLDKGPLTEDNPFQGLQRCDGDAVLWAALSEGHLQEDANLTAIEQSFARLPDHLRRHTGPALSDILVSGDKLEAARRVLRSVDRVRTQTSASVVQAKAKIAAAERDALRTANLLTEVIETSDATLEAPLALARLIDKRWLERGSVSPQELDLAESYTVEFRRADIGPMMQRTHAVALSLSQEFDASLELVTELPEDAESADALNRVVSILTERADDATFLHRILSLPAAQSRGLTTDTAIAVADRLIALGFSRQAYALAKRPQDRLRRGKRARLRAKALLLDQRPHQALLELADNQTDEANMLRAEALIIAGDYAAAGDLIRSSGLVDDANRLFWLADQPDHADLEINAKFNQVVVTTQHLTDGTARLPETPLADAENLLRDSAETRQRIADLFAILSQD